MSLTATSALALIVLLKVIIGLQAGSSTTGTAVTTLDVYGKIRFGHVTGNNMFSELGGTYSNSGLFLGCRSTNSGAGDYYDTIPSYTSHQNYPGSFIVTGANGGKAGLSFGVLDTGTVEVPTWSSRFYNQNRNDYKRRWCCFNWRTNKSHAL